MEVVYFTDPAPVSSQPIPKEGTLNPYRLQTKEYTLKSYRITISLYSRCSILVSRKPFYSFIKSRQHLITIIISDNRSCKLFPEFSPKQTAGPSGVARGGEWAQEQPGDMKLGLHKRCCKALECEVASGLVRFERLD